MRNNLSPPTPNIQKTNVIYRFKCPLPHGDAVEYIGLTSTTVEKRLGSHLQRGSILEHLKECHNIKPTKQQLSDNTTILDHAPDRYRLFIKEALHIIKHNPSINKQYDNFTNVLKLYTHRNCIDRRPSLIYPTTPIRSQLSPPSQNSLIIDNSPILRHNVSPQIIGRINNLVNGERTVPSNPLPYSPIAYRLRSHTLQSSQ